MSLRIAALLAGYRAGTQSPSEVIRGIYQRMTAPSSQPIWIQLVEPAAALARAAELESDAAARSLPLYGVPFAVKDNIDVAGMRTTAGCPAFAYEPPETATVVRRLLEAGAILIGKTNLDQFATGLVGTRSPYGACSSVFDDEYISGGSSSGSAVAVASGLVSFSLGTDTAGSGRVPAAFNNLIGAKPTRGLISTKGVVPACRSLDCVSIFALDAADASVVLGVAEGYDAADPYSRVYKQAELPWLGADLRLGVPAVAERKFFGDTASASLFEAAIARAESLGMRAVEIDYEPFRAVAELLYSGPWVAERRAAIESFMNEQGADMDPTVHRIISGADKHNAVDTFRAHYELERLRALTLTEWSKMDLLLLPTTGTIYRKSEVAADPVRLNTNLGYYTNFVNLLDLSAVAIPAGFRSSGLPFGVTLIGPAFADHELLALSSQLHCAQSLPLGGTPENTRSLEPMALAPAGCISIAVVGAHLTGQPLNHELTSRQARLLRTLKTTPGYRFYALRDTVPPKPGLVRDETFFGPGIEVEVWAVPLSQFGSFVAGIPAPLGIGTLQLEDGSAVKGFICEPYAVIGSREITAYGGWRNWRKAQATA